MAASNDAFISYRRELGFAWAKLVWDDLRAHGIDVFLDLENVRDAGSFDAKILHQIEGRPYFLVILSRGSLERCCNDGDWLRLELEHAVATNRMIVPLVMPPFDFSEADEALDEVVAGALRTANGVTVVPDYFDAAMERLRDDRLELIDISLRELGPGDEAFAEAARERASQLPPPTPPHGIAPVPPPPDASDGFGSDDAALTDHVLPPPDAGVEASDDTLPSDGAVHERSEASLEQEAPVSPAGDEEPGPSSDHVGADATVARASEPQAEAPPAVDEEPVGGSADTVPSTVTQQEASAPSPGGRRGRAWIAAAIVLLLAAAGAVLVLSGAIGGDDGPTDTMVAGDLLRPGDRLETEDGETTLVMGGDGVLRGSTSGSQWFAEPRSDAVAGSVARMQTDGNFVIYSSESTLRDDDATFATVTQGNRGATLVLLPGRFEIRADDGRTLYPRRATAVDTTDTTGDDDGSLPSTTIGETSPTTEAP